MLSFFKIQLLWDTIVKNSDVLSLAIFGCAAVSIDIFKQ